MTALLALPLVAVLADPTLWWVFLTKGPRRDQAQEVLTQGQKLHLANLERMYKAGAGKLAGPLAEDGQIRGIVVVEAGSREALLAQFAGDPFVQMGRLAIEASPWTGSVRGLGKPAEPFALQTATLAILRKGARWSEVADPLQAGYLASLEQRGDLVLSGDLTDGGDRRAVLLFRSSDVRHVQSLLDASPDVRSQRLQIELHPQMLSKGMIPADPLESFGWLRALAGACWSATSPDGARDTRCYDTQLGRYLRGTIRIEPSGGAATEGDSVLAADPDTGALTMWTWDSAGRRGTAALTLAGDAVSFVDATTPARREAWSRAGDDGFRVVRQDQQPDGTWKDGPAVSYTRVAR